MFTPATSSFKLVLSCIFSQIAGKAQRCLDYAKVCQGRADTVADEAEKEKWIAEMNTFMMMAEGYREAEAYAVPG